MGLPFPQTYRCGVCGGGEGYVSVLVAYFASLIEGARILQFFPAYLPESLWMLLTLLSLWLLQVAHLFLVPNSSIQERGCLPLVLVVQEGCSHLAGNPSSFPLYYFVLTIYKWLPVR